MKRKENIKLAALQAHADENDFLQLTPVSSGDMKRASGRENEQAFQLKSDFVRLLLRLFPDADLSSLLFSPHACIDRLHTYVTADNAYSPEVYKIVHQLGTNWRFLFFEICDRLRLPDEWSFEEIYLNRTALFRAPRKDYGFALDFALGLGVEGDFGTFYTQTIRELSDNRNNPKLLPARVRQVHLIYQDACKTSHLTQPELQEQIRQTVRKYFLARQMKRPITQADEKFLYQRLKKRFSKRKHGIARRSFKVAARRRGGSHLSVYVSGIRSLNQLLRRIAHIFIATLIERTQLQKILLTECLSEKQVALITPPALQITVSDSPVPDQSDYENIRNAIAAHYSETIVVSDRESKRFSSRSSSPNCLLADWPSPTLEQLPKNAQFSAIVNQFHEAYYSIVYRKKSPSTHVG